jgi:hypothetical protein
LSCIFFHSGACTFQNMWCRRTCGAMCVEAVRPLSSVAQTPHTVHHLRGHALNLATCESFSLWVNPATTKLISQIAVVHVQASQPDHRAKYGTFMGLIRFCNAELALCRRHSLTIDGSSCCAGHCTATRSRCDVREPRSHPCRSEYVDVQSKGRLL